MKLLLGIVIGAGLLIGGTALAEGHGIVIVSNTSAGYLGNLQKTYDQDNGIVCYLYKDGSGSAISCLHN